ncbi:MAG: Cu(I)/Ag(I) efflux system membrane fusion protein [Oleiphilaceae bacterium]|jgi:Cu(I)/Ag(I) efflux system membrane fusion protein
MKKLLISIIIFALGGFLGIKFGPAIIKVVGGEGGGLSMASSPETTEDKPLYWVAPMDKNYRRDEPGQSPMGMDLVPVYESEGEEGSVKISPVVENNLGVKTALVSKASLIMPVETVGNVQFDESKISHIHSRVEGWIEVLNVSAAGDPVKKGQTLYELYSPALVNAQEEYLAALRSGNKNLVRASKSRLFSLGLDDKQAKRLDKRRKVDQRVKVIAEQDGVVIDLKVRQGMHIKPSTEVLSIGTLDSVWVIGEIFERQSYLVKRGQDVEIELNAMPGKIWNGTLNYIYPQLDPKTRTLSIRVRIANIDHFLKPNMLANLRVLSTNEDVSLSIPKQALIKAGNHTRVVKALGDGMYKSVLVEAGFEGVILPEDATDEAELGSRIQILKGLNEGDRVVTSAQFLIDSESNIDAELARLEQVESSMDMSNVDETSASNSVRAKGKVNKIMPGMVNLTHDPIPEWDWPTMKMDFQVSESVDLNMLKEGDMIQFEVQKNKEFDHLIITINKAVK